MIKQLLKSTILSLGVLGAQQAVAQTTPEDPLAPKKNPIVVREQQAKEKEAHDAEQAEQDAVKADGLLRVRNEFWSYNVGWAFTQNSIVNANGFHWDGQGPILPFFAGVKTVGKPTKYKSKSQAFWLNILNADVGIDILRTPELQYSQTNYYQSPNGPVYRGTSVHVNFSQAYADFKLGSSFSTGNADYKARPYVFGGVAASPVMQDLSLQNSTNTRVGVGIDFQIGADGKSRMKNGKEIPGAMGRRRGLDLSLKLYKESYNPNQTFGNSWFYREAVQPGYVLQFTVAWGFFQGGNTDEDGSSLAPLEMQNEETGNPMSLEDVENFASINVQGEEIEIDGERYIRFELHLAEMLDDLGIQVEDEEEAYATASPFTAQRHVLS